MAKSAYFKQNNGQLPSKPPEYLGKLAQQTWRKIVPYLESTSRVQRIDASLVEQYCTEYELYRIAYADISKNGIQDKLFRSVQNSAGEIIGKDFVGVRKNPAVTTMNDALKQLKAIGSQLGLSPKARQDLMKIASSKKGKSVADQLKDIGLV
ncbi:phage terminase small subunit P27 family [Limosilactobacillus difficilis]|uniref:phage terminase small subunit P27 family n=1 Tax=Limosilactobacillus difficilis TaxID=2991838 RepID=UPI0024B8C18B|nr:phage terminase small subunit P27 family [Limosilactobacillus difficilis]